MDYSLISEGEQIHESHQIKLEPGPCEGVANIAVFKVEDEDEEEGNLSSEDKFNLEDAIAELTDFKYLGAEIAYDEIYQGLKNLKDAIRKACTHYKGQFLKPESQRVKPEDDDAIKQFLWATWCLDTMTPDVNKQLTIKPMLDLLESYGPAIYSGIARALIDRFEPEKWVAMSPPAREEPSAIAKRKVAKANRRASTAISKKERSPITDRPPTDHLIWGESGIMRGLVWTGKIAKLDPSYRHRVDCKVFGHNQLTIGQCWPRRIAALRDGAHGASMAGIVGDPNEGAYSIVVSGYYDEFDLDAGDTIRYSAPGAKESIARHADSDNNGARSLRRSIETRNPVRVLRKHGCRWEGGPADGLRYDGLYRVISFEEGENVKLGKFFRFALRRLSNQDPIATNRPSLAERQLFGKVSDGY